MRALHKTMASRTSSMYSYQVLMYLVAFFRHQVLAEHFPRYQVLMYRGVFDNQALSQHFSDTNDSRRLFRYRVLRQYFSTPITHVTSFDVGGGLWSIYPIPVSQNRRHGTCAVREAQVARVIARRRLEAVGRRGRMGGRKGFERASARVVSRLFNEGWLCAFTNMNNVLTPKTTLLML